MTSMRNLNGWSRAPPSESGLALERLVCAHSMFPAGTLRAARPSSVCLLSIDYYFQIQRLAISITVCLSVSVHRRAVPFTFTVHARDGSFRLFLRLGGRSFRFFHSRRRSASVAGT